MKIGWFTACPKKESKKWSKWRLDRKRREGKRVSPNTIPKDFITFSSSIVNLGVTQGHQHVAKSHRRSALDSRPWTRKLDYEYKDVGTFDRPIHEHHRANSLSMNVGWDWSQVAKAFTGSLFTHVVKRVCETALDWLYQRCRLWRMASN